MSMVLPICSLSEAFHVGTLDPAQRKAASYEGDGVSVSSCPEAWRGIARLGADPTWKITSRTDQEMIFLDMHSLIGNPELVATVEHWAIENGLAEHTDQWLSVFYDSEVDECRFSAERSRDSAKAEAVFLADEEVPEFNNLKEAETQIAAGHISAAIVCQKMLRLTPSGQECVRGSGSTGIDGREMAVVLWAERVAKEIDPTIIGCWWDDVYDPPSLSAPRGVIFTGALTEIGLDRIANFSPSSGLIVAPNFRDQEVPVIHVEPDRSPDFIP